KLRVIDAQGIIHSFAGGPGTEIKFGFPAPFTGAYSGDGGLVRDARFLLPGKPSVPQSRGYLLLSDSGNFRIRAIVDCSDPAYSQTALCAGPLPTSSINSTVNGSGGNASLRPSGVTNSPRVCAGLPEVASRSCRWLT